MRQTAAGQNQLAVSSFGSDYNEVRRILQIAAIETVVFGRLQEKKADKQRKGSAKAIG